MKDLISLHDVTTEELHNLLELGLKLKDEQKKGVQHHLLKGKTLGMIFTKSSTRTRVSFEVGMTQLGGYPLFLSANDIQLGRGETIYDTAKVLERYLDGIMIRTYAHSDVLELAEHADIPVINALTDLLHPCQVLADLQTIYEHKGTLEGLKFAYIGDGNNMANSIMYGCSKMGINCAIASPKGYEPDAEVTENAKADAKNIRIGFFITPAAGHRSRFVDELSRHMLDFQTKNCGVLSKFLDFIMDIIHIRSKFFRKLRYQLVRPLVYHVNASEYNHAFDVERPMSVLVIALIVNAERNLIAAINRIELMPDLSAVKIDFIISLVKKALD